MSEPSAQPPSSWSSFVVPALLVVAAALLLPKLLHSKHALVGKTAPDFTLDVVYNGAEQAQMRLGDYRGKPVVLDFWATWCGPCRQEIPILDRVATRYRERGLVVLGINTSDQAGLAAPFAAQRKLSYPILFDATDVSNLYGVDGLPTLVVIAKDGSVRSVRTGVVSEGALNQLVEEVL